ncbi:unnamed protein product [Calypogeia fissa]
MMAVSATEVLAELSKALTQLSQFRDDWNNISDDIQGEADSLNVKIKEYVGQFRGRDLPVELVRTLERATSRLEIANKRLKGLQESVTGSNACCQHIWWFYAKLSLTIFPQSLQTTLQKVREYLKKIDDTLDDSNLNQVGSAVRAYEKNQGISTIVYDNDQKYVPIEESQSAVIRAIEDFEGPLVILLHGGFGTGKSTLARKMCNLYGRNGESFGKFDHLIPVACENCKASDVTSKQYEILSNYAPTNVSKDDKDSKERIKSDLKSFFKGKKLLLILDKLSDTEFLSSMLHAARDDNDSRDDKILITSQRSTLCDGVCKDDTKSIPMASPTKEEARKILASLVGLENKQIPDQIKEIADEVIETYGRNPQALASFASTFSDAADKTIKRQWEDALDAIPEILENTETGTVLAGLDETVPRSLFQSMKCSVDSLQRKEAKCILYLMYACRGESVPETVLRIWCDAMKISGNVFNSCTNELTMKQLLKPPAQTSPSEINSSIVKQLQVEESPTWSLQSLLRYGMRSHIIGTEQEIKDVIEALIGNESSKQDNEADEMTLRIILCALYFDSHHPDEVVRNAVKKAYEISGLDGCDDTTIDLRQTAIVDLVWLLDQREVRIKWAAEDQGSVRKILLNYVRECKLDSENISYLLKVKPFAQLAILRTIINISHLEESRLLDENTIGFLEAIVDLVNVKVGVNSAVQMAAYVALGFVCVKAVQDKSTTLVANMPGVLDLLADALALPVGNLDKLAENATHALEALARCNTSGEVRRIVNKAGIVARFVKFMLQQTNPDLQRAASCALCTLLASEDDYVQLTITNEEGAIACFAHCLSNHGDNEVRLNAGRSLVFLSAMKDESLKLRIADGVLDSLVNCLLQKDNGSIQAVSARALAGLSNCDLKLLKLKVGNEPGALAGLANGLTQHDNDSLKRYVAEALGMLAGCRDDALNVRIADTQGALAGLVSCLSQGDIYVKEWSARALAGLSNCDLKLLKLKIGNEPGALAGLANGLTQHDNDSLKRYVAQALGMLAGCRDDALNVRIADTQGALAGLVSCLSHGDIYVKEWSARALAGLSNCDLKPLKLKVGNEPGALAGLANGLKRHDNDSLKRYVAQALGMLAGCRDDALNVRIVDTQGALAGLVSCLSHGDIYAKEWSARALAGLSSCAIKPLRLKIGNEPGALAGLANGLTQQDNDILKRYAAEALRMLAGCRDDALKVRIADTDGALAGLVSCLSQGDNLSVRKYSAVALGDLSDCKLAPLGVKIVIEPGALAGLVNCLTHGTVGEKMFSARAFANLSDCQLEPLKLKIANEPGALAGLANGLTQHDSHSVKVYSATALGRLANCQEDSVRERIADAEGALAGLVSRLAQTSNSALRVVSAKALANLSFSNSKALKLKVAKEERALAALVDCLSQRDHGLQAHAARIAENLACSPDAKIILLETEGLLQGLTNLLAKAGVDSDTKRSARKAKTLLLEECGGT